MTNIVPLHNFLKSLFSGHHTFHRVIQPQNIFCEGTVTWTEISENVHQYEESGTYLLHEKEQDFHQKRMFQFFEHGLDILKSDGTLLHQLYFLENTHLPLTLSHTHPCGEDIYALTLNMFDDQEFSMAYSVTGPHKDYKMVTRFKPFLSS